MEESKEIQKIYSLMQGVIYITVLMDITIFILVGKELFPEMVEDIFHRFALMGIYQHVLYSKLLTLVLITIVSIGTKSRKKIDLNPATHILLPLLLGLSLFFGAYFFYYFNVNILLYKQFSVFDLGYIITSLMGAVMIHISLDNVSKRISSSLMKDRFNIENESFEQSKKVVLNEYSVNIPMQFYYNRKVNNGWINIANPFRGTLLIGTPGSGKTFGVIIPFIKQHLAKGFSAVVYDYKFPDLGKVTYYHFLVNKRQSLKNHKFHVINLDEIEKSRRVNPLKADYIKTLADAVETAEALVESLRKSDRSSGADQFFNQSAINFLSSVIYFFSRFEGGKYSSLAHVLAFINRSYEEIFSVLFTEPELESLLSPFKSAFDKKAFDQLEGQIGTLKINISRLATKEAFWVFSGDDFNLQINNPTTPGVLVIANNPDTQNINSTCYALVINRLTRLVNKKDKLPTSIIVDELPTLYFHKIENLIATARSNKVSVLLGLQELPQFEQQYGKETAKTICAVIANVLSGSVRNKETLDWLEKLFGKVIQVKTGMSIDRSRTALSMNEYMEYLIPAAKIAGLKTGELVGRIPQEAAHFNGQYVSSSYHCKVNLNTDLIKEEEKNYIDLPNFYNFGGNKDKILRKNMLLINSQIENIVKEYA
ncbi:type IV secretory system conjugative DNA transfer family protein [Chondrinema litorale]|uniref:type IV secretory system conjugative DNA transfer family protein n=1 Tax=Chondrinema litorale TaxID=2994555 RepID=UPI002542C2A9|nr:type IV secretory system conjugative DNA transfer family protein [Chondrinema litorale]UZR99612.1 type IV secretory system conjugative DNA transfer family protein [Chondrinema litorale]